jgi:signal transduction histidine kinase
VHLETLKTRASLTDPALVGSVTALACLGVWAELHYATTPTPSPAGAYALTLGAGAALLPRRRAPLASTAACLVACYLYRAVGYPGFSVGLIIFVCCYTLAADRKLVYGLAPALIAWIIPALPPHSLALLNSAVVFPPVGMVSVALIGDSNRRRRLEYEERVRQSAATAEARLGRHTAEERLRIARELHDVLAHTISVVAVQSSVALEALEDENPAEARAAMHAVRGAARQAMPELRATLDLLRGAQGGQGPAPQPGLEQLPELACQATNGGLTVELSVPERLGRASPLVELTAYRIVQESLTNVRKHAGADHARVAIRRDGSLLTIEVLDEGGGGPGEGTGASTDTSTGPGAEPPGFGLLGMRERAQALGGTVVAGPRPEGGYRVFAELPWIPRSAGPEPADGPGRNGAT